MICHICKDRVATVRLKEIINNVVTEIHLCQECYKAREFSAGAIASDGVGAMPEAKRGKKKAATVQKTLKCPECGMTEDQFRAKGRLGCSTCYTALTEALQPILAKAHGSAEHRGKHPRHTVRSLDLKVELRRLQDELQKAIRSENYEQAARLRDKIRQYESM
ncbi:MAG: UvrB/UvrC motif-containing protein [Candidatus Abyssubacteria bacterium]